MDEDDRRALLLDLDGTLADTVALWRSAYESFLTGFGLVGSEDEFALLNGPPLADVVSTLSRTHHLAGAHAVLVEQYRSGIEDIAALANPLPGARSLLERAQLLGWHTCVVTSSRRVPAWDWLARQELDQLVEGVVGGDDVERGKPDPEPYTSALERLRCEAAGSLAVEDSPQGALAAVRAGVPTHVLNEDAARAVKASPLFRGVLSGLDELAARL